MVFIIYLFYQQNYNVINQIFELKAKSCFREASSNCTQDELEELEEFKNKISNNIYKECDSLKGSLKMLNEFVNEARHFQELELVAREKVKITF
jgi:hypothetical protein